MKLKVKSLEITTGGTQVAILHLHDARLLDLHSEDRVLLKKKDRSTTAIIDIANSAEAVMPGSIGLFEETMDALDADEDDVVILDPGEKPESVAYIKKKLENHELNEKEIKQIVSDISNGRLSTIELTTYVTANYVHGMSMRETILLTRAMASTGEVLRKRKGIIADIHCIGGVAGNRTTLVVVPILVAEGLLVPKTASRAITSPAGTADTMEVLCSVTLEKNELEAVLDNIGGFITWGGAINLAPSDDKIIRIEHPLQIDAEGQMLASIMAKKSVVGATHLLMDIPMGFGAKVANKKEARRLGSHFAQLSKALGIKLKLILTNGSQPIGHGIGPALEAKDCLFVLENDPRGAQDLREKSLLMASQMLEFCGKCKKGKGRKLAEDCLSSGRAHHVFMKMIKAQGGRPVRAEEIELSPFCTSIISTKSGKIKHVDNILVGKVARLAGAPADKGSGVYLHVHEKERVKKGQSLLTIYADNKIKLNIALQEAKKKGVIIVG